MNDITINISLDFSRTPGARTPEEGTDSGQEFREKILFPKISEAIKSKVKLVIVLDGTAGLGTSFLEESFGGLIRENNVSYSDIKETIVLISDEDDEYIEEINGYLLAAYEQSDH